MIGQTRLREQISHQVEMSRFPTFAIFVGPRGCGKKLLTQELFNPIVNVTMTVDGIREMIQCAYTTSIEATYVLADADNLSTAACNAMLKVVEEPPMRSRFIVTCTNIENIPDTIRSRAVVYQFDPYTFDELCEFCEANNIEFTTFMAGVAETPGDILKLLDYEGLEDFVDLVINNIASVSGANAFKIGEKIDLKNDDPTKYNLELFLTAFSSKCIDYMMEHDPANCLKFSKAVAITGNTIADLNIKSLNRQMLFDKWLLDIRGEWM